MRRVFLTTEAQEVRHRGAQGVFAVNAFHPVDATLIDLNQADLGGRTIQFFPHTMIRNFEFRTRY